MNYFFCKLVLFFQEHTKHKVLGCSMVGFFPQVLAVFQAQSWSHTITCQAIDARVVCVRT